MATFNLVKQYNYSVSCDKNRDEKPLGEESIKSYSIQSIMKPDSSLSQKPKGLISLVLIWHCVGNYGMTKGRVDFSTLIININIFTGHLMEANTY